MKIKPYHRTKDVIFGSEELEELFTIRKFPIFMGCTTQDESKDIFSDQSWQISNDNGIIQLKNLIPLDILYSENHNAGVVGGKWLNHHKEFGEFIIKNSPKKILEIGGSHGILAKHCMKQSKLDWTILEPNPNPVQDCQAKFIKGFFDSNFKFKDSFDTIVHSHVFEHVYEPIDFMKNISNASKINTRLIFSIPNMKSMLEKKYTNCLNFEHTYFLTEKVADHLLISNGFFIKEKKFYLDDHSIFYSCVKKDTSEVHSFENNYEVNKRIFKDFVNYHKDIVQLINNRIKNSPSVYLFGAHIFSQYLIMMGLKTKTIKCILDNDLEKHNKRLYGTKLFVYSPKILKKEKNPVIILKAGVYNQEIKKDILENINKNAIFI